MYKKVLLQVQLLLDYLELNQQQILLALFLGFSSLLGLLPFGSVHVLKLVPSCLLKAIHKKY